MARSLDLAKVRGDQAKEAGDFVQTQGRRNLIINGGFDVWQRGTSLTSFSQTYTADRWNVSSSVTTDITKETDDSGDYIKMLCNADVTSGRSPNIRQGIEFSNWMLGKTCTLTFEAKGSFVGGIEALCQLRDGSVSGSQDFSTTLIDQPLGQISTDWKKHSLTFLIPQTISGTPTMLLPIIACEQETVKTGESLEVRKVQLELGDTATPFEQRGYGEELALCQRYYEVSGTQHQYTNEGGVKHYFYIIEKRTTGVITLESDHTAGGGANRLRTNWVTFTGLSNGNVSFTVDAEL